MAIETFDEKCVCVCACVLGNCNCKVNLTFAEEVFADQKPVFICHTKKGSNSESNLLHFLQHKTNKVVLVHERKFKIKLSHIQHDVEHELKQAIKWLVNYAQLCVFESARHRHVFKLRLINFRDGTLKSTFRFSQKTFMQIYDEN